jgi:tetratricopeptide (TPR) repeat protein
MGRYSHPISTRNQEAQRFFDQGLNMLYGFNRYEAMRSFRRASELDPAALMPIWGMVMANGPHINMDLDGDVDQKAYCDAIQKGRALPSRTAERERSYFEAASKRCGNQQNVNPEADAIDYRDAMRELTHRYPDDLDAATFYAESLMILRRWKWYGPDGVAAEGMDEAIRTLESVMRRQPDHPGANHLYIHAVEMSPTPERAIPSAQRLLGIVPAAGHLVHMPGHIFMLLGDYEMVASSNERAAQVDREYMDATGIKGIYLGYYVHNLHFIAVGRAMQGRFGDAKRAADQLASAVNPLIAVMPAMAEYFAPAPLFALLRFHRWADTLKLEPPDPKLPVNRALWHFARVSALAGLNRKTEARQEFEAFNSARKQVPNDSPWANNKSADILSIADSILQAKLADQPDVAIAHWQSAVEQQDRLQYDEPPPWFYPIRESLGGALLRSGRPAEAEAVFREGLKRSPRNARLLFGLMESLKAQKKEDAAGFVRREFEQVWKKSDTTLQLANL